MNDTLQALFAGGGPAAEELRGVDWTAHPLGPPDLWPPALKVAVQMMLASEFPKSLFWGPKMISLHNSAFRIILGDKPPAQGQPMRAVWAEVYDEVEPLARRALQGEAVFVTDMPLTINRHGTPEQAFFTFCYSPIRDETGAVAGFIDTVIETTPRVIAERELAIRNAELTHRIKNTFSIISVIARQTLRGAPDMETAWQVLSQRLGALAETHSVLSAEHHVAAPMDEVVTAALRPHRTGEGRFHLTGGPIRLREQQALALSLALNELATNAVKYGALSAEGGRVDLAWAEEEGPAGPQVRFTWVERGGPPVAPPTRRSFGSRLIEQIVPQDFGGSAQLDYAPDGFSYTLVGKLGPSA
ncbi:sensor histidine kinase [Frigidibacter sp.]|uniref:sensor histidine kinase n=1 Tax=Frigidibacter sp. TaxID=2586418 RepID=UPI00273597CF|nr:PAS domain-containing sensor histidine kinase [Frigidibacter sp.]MDP3339597.1 HWE histidine kinase domain-containing protein [Frigidibacter sp.]